MRKRFMFIGFMLAISVASHSAIAMHYSDPAERSGIVRAFQHLMSERAGIPQTIPEAIRAVDHGMHSLAPQWAKGVAPDTVTIKYFDDPITDELLLALNPTWNSIQETASLEQKNQIMEAAMNYPGGDWEYGKSRWLMALAVCVGADSNLKSRTSNKSIYRAMFWGDIQLVRYLVAKGADPMQSIKKLFSLKEAKPKGKDMIMALRNYYLDQHQAFLGFLFYLKSNFPAFYRIKDLRKLCFQNISPMRKLHELLCLKRKDNKTAYDLWPIPELNPESYGFSKVFPKLV